jgi:hypothetical protein
MNYEASRCPIFSSFPIFLPPSYVQIFSSNTIFIIPPFFIDVDICSELHVMQHFGLNSVTPIWWS